MLTPNLFQYAHSANELSAWIGLVEHFWAKYTNSPTTPAAASPFATALAPTAPTTTIFANSDRNSGDPPPPVTAIFVISPKTSATTSTTTSLTPETGKNIPGTPLTITFTIANPTISDVDSFSTRSHCDRMLT
ncbi:hypothetical protein SprV_0501860500 [Sparganum proliferum]